ncbi:hypothetical protein [Streptomyces sp. CFMR 7]|uniref:hypothetical protein n=1 Tax=Streptomyces sp. CFMR 7 TaxID=1649184 RepID=UPI0011A63659|nr:hypothetical protein [Streptomyces sp. CFMR 7]
MVRRWVPALVLGGLWWWAVLRLALQPEQAGVVEGAVAAGGWGLSLLPVHVAGSGGTGVGRPVTGWLRAISGPGRELRRDRGWWGTGVTRAWRRRRSGGGSGRS